MAKAPSKEQLLDKLVVKGGSGTAEDVAAVRAEARWLPDFVLALFKARKVKIVACRGSVTDVERKLRGKLPRGWDPARGLTWDDVPGAYLIGRKRVAVATVEAGGKRVVPPRGQGHGSFNLVVHEAMHGHDIAGDRRLSGSSGFRTARDTDLPRLPPYEAQQGLAGIEETYAESAARHYSGDPALPGDWPALAAWWLSDPSDAGDEEMPAAPLETEEAADVPIGTASLEPDGSLFVDLRADEPGAAVGHAAFHYGPGGAEFEAERRETEAAGAEEGPAARSTVLIPPWRGR